MAAVVERTATPQGVLNHDVLVKELSATSPGRLVPLQFFVSWQGVLTLAYGCAVPPEWWEDAVARMQGGILGATFLDCV